MQLRELIRKLQDIYDETVTEEYLEIIGEPEVVIDTFKYKSNNKYVHTGWNSEIEIDKSIDGNYFIISKMK